MPDPDPRSSTAAAPAPSPATRPVSVVTGGSEGIGLAIAHLLARRGHELLLVARRPERLSAAANEIATSSAVSVATLALDLTSPDACHALDAALSRLGAHVGVLVNAAGSGQSGDFASADPAVIDRVMALNMAAPSRLMRHVLPGMRARRSGGIINIASVGGYTPGPYQATYYASKAYLISLSEAVAAEVRGDGVRVTVVAPGPVNTEFHAKMRSESALYRLLVPSSSPESVARWGVRGFELGLRVVVPGVLNILSAGALRLMPHILLVPLMAWLLEPRRRT